MAMIAEETAVLVSKPFARISLQLAKECQGSFVLDLLQDLINQGVQRGEACKSSCEGLERLSSLLSPVLAIFHPLSYRVSSCLSLFWGFSSRASNASSTFMYLVAL